MKCTRNTNEFAYSTYKKIGICDVNKIDIDGDKLKTLNWAELPVTNILYLPENSKNIEDINCINAEIKIKSVELIETPFSAKFYKTALLSSDGTPAYENGIIKTSPCSNAFQLQSNAEGTCLTGRKLIISGIIQQEITYTADVPCQSTHSIKSVNLFDSYIIVYPNFINVSNLLNNIIAISPLDPAKTILINGYAYNHNDGIEICMSEEFCVDAYIEDISLHLLDNRSLYENIVIFLHAYPNGIC